MTHDELIAACREIIAAGEVATAGPWYDDGYRVYGPTENEDKRQGVLIFEYKHINDVNYDDSDFVVKARNTAPAVARAVLEMLGVEIKLKRIALLDEHTCNYCSEKSETQINNISEVPYRDDPKCDNEEHLCRCVAVNDNE